jgi:3-methyladenine DNA glycosylase AlkD
MDAFEDSTEAKSLAAAIDAEIRVLPVQNTATERAVRQKYSRQLKQAAPGFIMVMAKELFHTYGHPWIAYELIRAHKVAFHSLDEAILEEFGQGINSWWTVDAFARTLSGPAWLAGQVSDDVILKWVRSEDLWRRRAALVSTVAWNVRSQGGPGDVPRTLTVCRLLVADHEDMVVKALSWALRELVVHDPVAVQVFLNEYKNVLAARVKYEVGNKLRIGLKKPKKPDENNWESHL